MYKGYNLQLSEQFFETNFKKLYEAGKARYSREKGEIEKVIKAFKLEDDHIDASKMQANWFPPIRAHIFLSHSHKDEKLAIAFSEWINQRFGLKVFVDSCLWGNSSVLQQLLDDEYCKNEGKNTYDYNLRNLTTSHVHMMLQTALATVIDITECVIFLNTPSSICPNDVISKTLSPWIYSELTTTKYVRNKDKKDYRLELLTEQRVFDDTGKYPTFEYNAPTEHLIQINNVTLYNWAQRYHNSKSINAMAHALDCLYSI